MKTILRSQGPFAVLVLLFLTACPSIASLQTAKTMPADATQSGLAAAFVSVEGNTQGVLGVGWVRYGLIDRLDVGVQVGVPGGAYGDLKYMLVGDQDSLFAVSSGLGFGLLRERLRSASADDIADTVFEGHMPLYASVHPSEPLAAYLVPRYVFRVGRFQDSDGNSFASTSLLGATLGLKIGSDGGLMLEGSMLYPFREAEGLTRQFTIAFFWPI